MFLYIFKPYPRPFFYYKLQVPFAGGKIYQVVVQVPCQVPFLPAFKLFKTLPVVASYPSSCGIVYRLECGLDPVLCCKAMDQYLELERSYNTYDVIRPDYS